MSLPSIRKANKKWRHEKRRQQKSKTIKAQKLSMRAKRKELYEISRSRIKRREDEISYVDALRREIE